MRLEEPEPVDWKQALGREARAKVHELALTLLEVEHMLPAAVAVPWSQAATKHESLGAECASLEVGGHRFLVMSLVVEEHV